MKHKDSKLLVFFKSLAVFMFLHALVFLILWVITGEKYGAVFLQLIIFLLPSLFAFPYIYRRLMTSEPATKMEIKSGYERFVANLLAATVGLLVSSAVAYVVFMLPAAILGMDSMHVMNFFSGIPAFLIGCLCFYFVTKWAGPIFLKLLFPKHFLDESVL